MDIEALFTQPRALDLYLEVMRRSSEWPALDLSIKSVAKIWGFARRDANPIGASSIDWFDRWAATGDPGIRQGLVD